MIITIILWVIKSLLILGIFQFAVPPIVNGVTGNRWIKLPVMIVFAILAGVFMAWLNYVPYLLFFIWLALNKQNLHTLTEEKFESEAGMVINKTIFFISSYSYIIVACLLAVLLQAVLITNGDPMGEGIPLWKHLLGFELTKVENKVEVISLASVIFYCIHGMFVNYQLLHMRDFRGTSEVCGLILSISAVAGTITGLSYLIYYGWTVVWWAPILIFFIGIVFSLVSVYIEELVGKFALSMFGFLGWPICAYLMFRYIPK